MYKHVMSELQASTSLSGFPSCCSTEVLSSWPEASEASGGVRLVSLATGRKRCFFKLVLRERFVSAVSTVEVGAACEGAEVWVRPAVGSLYLTFGVASGRLHVNHMVMF
jgi:hypothetical protein